ncbi:MAG: 16S rRNA (guanine(527)-N(7))-methyltransferase RsmG [Candidatus Acidiferrales bacterium]
MTKLSNSEIKKLLAPYGVAASDLLCVQVQTYMALLLEWNQRVSLTTVTDPIAIVKFHFGESMFAASAVPIRNGRLADVGSGPGFPAIPLSMACDELFTTPIESNSKKSTFLAEVTRRLSLRSVTPFRGRMEDFPLREANFDWITARALGMHSELVTWASKALTSPDGQLVMWLGESDAEIVSRTSNWNWHDPIQIPGSDHRCLLIGKPWGSES